VWLGVVCFATFVGFDRDRAFYPTVIRVVAQADEGSRAEIVGAEDLHTIPLAIRQGHRFRVRDDGDALWFAKPRQGPEVRAGTDVQHFDRVVAKRGSIESLTRRIEGEAIPHATPPLISCRGGTRPRRRA
jgi:hypothetical protein